MGAIIGFLFNPQTAPIIVGLVALLAGAVALVVGNVPGSFVAFGLALLIFTAAEIHIWKVTVPAGLILIVAGILWGSIAPLVP